MVLVMKKLMPGEERFAKNMSQLADIVGIKRTVLHDYRIDLRYHGMCPKKRPDGRENIAEWRDFLNRIAAKTELRANNSREDIIDLKKRATELDIQAKQAKVDILRGGLVKKELVKDVFRANLSRISTRLERWLVNELPAQVVGLSELEISKKAKDGLRRVLEECERDTADLEAVSEGSRK